MDQAGSAYGVDRYIKDVLQAAQDPCQGLIPIFFVHWIGGNNFWDGSRYGRASRAHGATQVDIRSLRGITRRLYVRDFHGARGELLVLTW